MPWPVRTGDDHLDPLAALGDGIERRHRIGSTRQGLAGFDPLRQRRQERRRIRARIGDRRRFDRKSVGERDRARGTLRRHDIVRERKTRRRRGCAFSRFDGTDTRFNKREDGAQRRQPRNALKAGMPAGMLVAGVFGHRRYDKDV